MFEIILVTMVLAGGGAGTLAWFNQRARVRPQLLGRRGPSDFAALAPSKSEIPEDIRAELDETPMEAWARQFHKSLQAAGAKALAYVPGDIIIEKQRGRYIETQEPDRIALEGCDCADCKSLLIELNISVEIPGNVVDIYRSKAEDAYELFSDTIEKMKLDKRKRKA